MATISREELDNISKATKALEGYTKAVEKNNEALKKHEEFAKEINDLSDEYNKMIDASAKKYKKTSRAKLVAEAKLLKFERDNMKAGQKKKDLTKKLSSLSKRLTAEEKRELALEKTKYNLTNKSNKLERAAYKNKERELKVNATQADKMLKRDEKIYKERKKVFSTKNLDAYRKGFSRALSGKGNFKQAMTNYRESMKEQMKLAAKTGKGMDVKINTNEVRKELFESFAKVDIDRSLFGRFEASEKRAMRKLARDYENATTPDERLEIARRAQVIKKVTELEKKEAKEIEEAKMEAAAHVARTRPGSKGLETLTGMGSSAAGGIKGFFKGDQAGVQKSEVQTKAWAEQAKKAGGSLKFLGGGLEALSKGLAMIGKLNWVFALLGAVKALISAVNELDKFMKALNQTFLELAGPSVGIGNVKDEMGRFNKEIFDLGRNIKLGIQGEEVQSMFKAMGGAGMSLQGVMQKIGSYGKAIESARAMSLQFGVSFDKMGGDMTSQMIDLNSSLDDVAKNFNKLSFDAAKAGISSDKFYQTVESTAMSLSYYGNNVKYVSGLLRDFYKTGNLAFKDAAKVTDTFATAFENMDENARRKFINLTAGPATDKAIENLIADAEKKKKDLGEEAIKDPKRKNEIQKQIDATDALIREFQAAQTKEDKSYDMGARQVILPYMSKYVMPMLMGALQNVGTDATGEKISLTALVRDIFPGLDQNQVFKGIIQQADIAAITYEKLNASLVDSIRNNDRFGSQVKDLTKQYAEGKVTFADIKDRLAGLMKSAAPGATDEEIGKLLDATENNPSVILKGLKGDRTDLVNDFISYMGTLNKGDAKISEKNRQELIGAITPLEKYAEITKDYLKFAAGDLLKGILAATSETAAGIGYLVEGNKKARKAKEKDDKERSRFATSGKAGDVSNIVKQMIAMEEAKKTATPEYEDLKNKLKGYTGSKATGGMAEHHAQNVRMEYEVKKSLESELIGLIKQRDEAAARDEDVSVIEKKIDDANAAMKSATGSADRALGGEVEKYKPAEFSFNEAPEADALTLSSGYAKLSEGDVVVHGREMADVIGRKFGGFADRVAGSMKPLAAPASGTARANQYNWGGVNINFNAPADASNPAAYRNMFVDAVEQIFDRKMYAEKSKGKGR